LAFLAFIISGTRNREVVCKKIKELQKGLPEPEGLFNIKNRHAAN